MSARALPLFFVRVPAGVLADRWPRHRLLIATGVGQALTVTTLGTLVLFGVVGLPLRAGWLVGSLGAGALIALLGSGPAYLAVAAAYMAGAAALVRGSAPRRALPAAPESIWQNIVGFIPLMRRNRTLLALMALNAGAEVLGFSHQTLLHSLARDVLQSGPEGLGVLNAVRAVGGILGLSVSMRGAVAGGGTMFLAVLAGFGLSIVGLGLAPHLVGF